MVETLLGKLLYIPAQPGKALCPNCPVAREADHCVGPGAALSGSSFLSPWSRTVLLENLSQARGRFWKLGKL